MKTNKIQYRPNNTAFGWSNPLKKKKPEQIQILEAEQYIARRIGLAMITDLVSGKIPVEEQKDTMSIFNKLVDFNKDAEAIKKQTKRKKWFFGLF